MKITITKSNISNGIPRNEANCPIVLAMSAIKGVTHCSVSDKVVRFLWKNSESILLYLPQKARLFIEAFDDDKPVEPFSFTLPI